MHHPSFFRVAFSSLLSGFFKIIGILTGIVLFWIALSIASSTATPPRSTSTVVQPNHTWKVQPFSLERPTIAQIRIDGGIGFHDGKACVMAETIEKILCDLAQMDLKEGALKGIIITINTGGGTARDSETIRALIQEAKSRFHVPCVVYVDGLCASGGMMIACAADQIVASPSSLIGSIGVLLGGPSFNVSKPMEQYGVLSKTIYAGKGKDEMNPFRPWKENEGADFQEDANSYYERFISIVCQARPKITPEFLKAEGAKVYTAQAAKELGFIDSIENTYFRCLEKFASSLTIVDDYQVIELAPHITLSSLFGMESCSFFKKPVIEHHVQIPGSLDEKLMGKPLFLYHP